MDRFLAASSYQSSRNSSIVLQEKVDQQQNVQQFTQLIKQSFKDYGCSPPNQQQLQCNQITQQQQYQKLFSNSKDKTKPKNMTNISEQLKLKLDKFILFDQHPSNTQENRNVNAQSDRSSREQIEQINSISPFTPNKNSLIGSNSISHNTTNNSNSNNKRKQRDTKQMQSENNQNYNLLKQSHPSHPHNPHSNINNNHTNHKLSFSSKTKQIIQSSQQLLKLINLSSPTTSNATIAISSIVNSGQQFKQINQVRSIPSNFLRKKKDEDDRSASDSNKDAKVDSNNSTINTAYYQRIPSKNPQKGKQVNYNRTQSPSPTQNTPTKTRNITPINSSKKNNNSSSSSSYYSQKTIPFNINSLMKQSPFSSPSSYSACTPYYTPQPQSTPQTPSCIIQSQSPQLLKFSSAFKSNKSSSNCQRFKTAASSNADDVEGDNYLKTQGDISLSQNKVNITKTITAILQNLKQESNTNKNEKKKGTRSTSPISSKQFISSEFKGKDCLLQQNMNLIKTSPTSFSIQPTSVFSPQLLKSPKLVPQNNTINSNRENNHLCMINNNNQKQSIISSSNILLTQCSTSREKNRTQQTEGSMTTTSQTSRLLEEKLNWLGTKVYKNEWKQQRIQDQNSDNMNFNISEGYNFFQEFKNQQKEEYPFFREQSQKVSSCQKMVEQKEDPVLKIQVDNFGDDEKNEKQQHSQYHQQQSIQFSNSIFSKVNQEPTFAKADEENPVKNDKQEKQISEQKEVNQQNIMSKGKCATKLNNLLKRDQSNKQQMFSKSQLFSPNQQQQLKKPQHNKCCSLSPVSSISVTNSAITCKNNNNENNINNSSHITKNINHHKNDKNNDNESMKRVKKQLCDNPTLKEELQGNSALTVLQDLSESPLGDFNFIISLSLDGDYNKNSPIQEMYSASQLSALQNIDLLPVQQSYHSKTLKLQQSQGKHQERQTSRLPPLNKLERKQIDKNNFNEESNNIIKNNYILENQKVENQILSKDEENLQTELQIEKIDFNEEEAQRKYQSNNTPIEENNCSQFDHHKITKKNESIECIFHNNFSQSSSLFSLQLSSSDSHLTLSDDIGTTQQLNNMQNNNNLFQISCNKFDQDVIQLSLSPIKHEHSPINLEQQIIFKEIDLTPPPQQQNEDNQTKNYKYMPVMERIEENAQEYNIPSPIKNFAKKMILN